MSKKNQFPPYNNSPETSFEENELTETELEPVAGGFTPVPIPEGKFDKIRGDLTQIKLTPTALKGIVQGGNQH